MTTTADGILQTGHIGLNVTDLDRSVPFYTRVFGLRVQTEGEDQGRRWAFLERDGRLVLTLWQRSHTSFAATSAGLHHLSFQAASLDEVRAAEAVLRDLGAEILHGGVVPHGENTASGGIFFTDPDGIRLEIYAPDGADTAAAPYGAAPTCGFF
ncbi:MULTISPECIES: VOC family protein [Streptomyces]|uniref:VOC family protein n=1 Tax=Streptomyces thermoviolaceus subsp. thermoviolaceus TaxID=66860 RepID=A0ABX0YZN6_STRTL|nr:MULTISPECIES: VOC family protein [Streptomyces]WTD46110.1 VOC family protein [Streptomyces thermoviolaceus]NJP16641.1 VOC family protein [Streptomyces thermoviolaceus subsp. thermoviolaceus]RSS06848.1 VOC family protein [Streptomyces sp. WAC00469]GGV80907.1 lactoylglutathione lyase [Streptomyces thermoviolaceus subsp. apingens]GHA74524.1 lactoylglutathione lyase [Streptomyces thermoviolaceus subsp. thermoviolaceus]